MQRKAILILICLLMGGCSIGGIRLGFPGVYRIDIPQGNVITQEMVDQLQPGMTKRQVRFVMGTPLVVDTFNQERWDYLHSMESKAAHVPRRISACFSTRMCWCASAVITHPRRRPASRRPKTGKTKKTSELGSARGPRGKLFCTRLARLPGIGLQRAIDFHPVSRRQHMAAWLGKQPCRICPSSPRSSTSPANTSAIPERSAASKARAACRHHQRDDALPFGQREYHLDRDFSRHRHRVRDGTAHRPGYWPWCRTACVLPGWPANCSS